MTKECARYLAEQGKPRPRYCDRCGLGPCIYESKPADRSKIDPVADDHREIDPATGMQKQYVVLSAEERAKGFVRPLRFSYLHKKCGGVTYMGDALSETYARDPKFYTGTFCSHCRDHRPLDEFVWEGTDIQVGT